MPACLTPINGLPRALIELCIERFALLLDAHSKSDSGKAKLLPEWLESDVAEIMEQVIRKNLGTRL